MLNFRDLHSPLSSLKVNFLLLAINIMNNATISNQIHIDMSQKKIESPAIGLKYMYKGKAEILVVIMVGRLPNITQQ